MSNNKPILIIAGPTAVGKTDASLLLAQELGAEIVSADSMQIYRGMDIGTASLRGRRQAGAQDRLGVLRVRELTRNGGASGRDRARDFGPTA